MHQYTFFILLAPFALAFAFLVFLHVWRQRKKPVAAFFLVFMFIGIGWTFSYIFEVLSQTDSRTFFWSRFGYLFIATSPVALYLFVARFLRLDKWSGPWHIGGLLIIPITTNVMIWHPILHRLVWEQYSIIKHGNFSVNIIFQYGIWFWISNVFNYTLVFTSIVLLIVYTIRSSILYRRQAIWILIGLSFPVLVNFLYTFRLIPNLTMDYTPLTFIVLGISLSMGIFREQIFDLSPLMREALLDHIDDGLVLIDPLDRVVDINPSAAYAFQVDREKILGTPITGLLGNWGELLQQGTGDVLQQTLLFQQGEKYCYYDLKITRLRNRSGQPQVSILLMRDVTERVRLLEEMQQLAIQDALTELYNRRHFFALTRTMLDQAIRYQRNASVLIMDIDHFKLINDNFGHASGDRVLQKFSAACQQILRSSDILARYGGEEFVIYLPETANLNAVLVGERLRKMVAGQPMLDDLEESRITVSIGVASYLPEMGQLSLDALVDRADQALYQAKQRGRNQVVYWGENR